MLLVSAMPTVSQLRAAWRATHAIHDGTHGEMAGRQDFAHAHCTQDHGRPDDCFKKCGYCDFLGHTPSLAGVPYLTLLITPVPNGVVARTAALPRQEISFNAAHPRGPPSVLV